MSVERVGIAEVESTVNATIKLSIKSDEGTTFFETGWYHPYMGSSEEKGFLFGEIMKTILVYGDSNTWGQTSDDSRYQTDERWTSVLKKSLGEEYEVVSAGLSGRIAGSYEIVEPIKRGKDSFEVIYRQAFPIDLLIISLGTNDIKDRYDISAEDISQDLLWYSEKVKEWKDYKERDLSPQILYILPANFDEMKFSGSVAKKRQIIQILQSLNREFIVPENIDVSEDGVHFSAKGHLQMANIVSNKLKEMNI